MIFLKNKKEMPITLLNPHSHHYIHIIMNLEMLMVLVTIQF